jgi:hypothetical protein
LLLVKSTFEGKIVGCLAVNSWQKVKLSKIKSVLLTFRHDNLLLNLNIVIDSISDTFFKRPYFLLGVDKSLWSEKADKYQY